MTEKKENKSKRISKEDLKSVLGGTILASEKVTKQLPFVFFVAFMFIGLITNRYWTEKTIRKINRRDSRAGISFRNHRFVICHGFNHLA